MRIRSRSLGVAAEGDLTPMIDMTFQLIAFFMVIINFTEAERNERVVLPVSELAQPPEAPLVFPLTIQLTADGTIIFGGEDVSLERLREMLRSEVQIMDRLGEDPAKATVIIRGHMRAKTGRMQELIKVCQETGFETFALRAKQEDRT